MSKLVLLQVAALSESWKKHSQKFVKVSSACTFCDSSLILVRAADLLLSGKSSVVTKTVFAILVFIMDVAEENAEEKIQQETRGTDENETKEEDPKREITQTDHLNRRLLGAFLARLNSSESTGVLPSNNLPQMDIYEDEDFETDENCTDNRLFKEKNINEAPKSS